MRSRVGVIIPPRYFDTSAKELQSLASDIDVLHTQMRLGRSFGFTLDEIATGTADEIERCVESLADAGAEVVLQLGTPFSTVHGWERGSEIQRSISARVDIPFEMMGLSIPAGVHALGANRVALATVYYGQAWVERYTGFVSGAGLTVVGAESFVDQGRFRDDESAWNASFDGFDPELVIDSVSEVAASFPEADAIIVPGMPGLILPYIAEAEARIGVPIISYFAIWWRCLAHLGRQPAQPAGKLLDLLRAADTKDRTTP